MIVDDELVVRFEDNSTQPIKRIKQESTDPDPERSKVFVDAITQTEAFDAELKFEIATQTDRPLDYACKLCRHKSPDQNLVQLISDLDPLDPSDSIKNPSEKNLNKRQIPETIVSSNSHLKRNQRSHTREKPFECELCEKRFNQLGNLQRHKTKIHSWEKPNDMKNHTGEKPYECELCEKRFNQLGNLQTHKRRNHTGEKPVKCKFCGKRFVSFSDLKMHRRILTGEKPYECEFWNKRFARSDALIEHRRTHTGRKPYACEFCEKIFSQKSGLRNHRRIRHKND